MRGFTSFLHKHRLVILLALFCFVTRIVSLTLLPMFTDESIYIYWAKFIAVNHSHWFLSLTDGKPPLLVWMMTVFLSIFPQHAYLFAGRLPSVFAGVLSIIALYQVALLLFRSQKIALIAGVLYLLHPFLLLYDRLALFDSFLSAMLLWSTYFSIKTMKTKSIVDAVLWGVCLGIAFLFKPTALLFWILLPVCLVILIWKTSVQKHTKKLIGLTLVALVISEGINNLQRFSSVYFMMGQKNQQFQQPIQKLLTDPLQLTWGNLHGFFSWIIPYDTMLLFLAGIVGMGLLLWQKTREGLVLFLLWFVPIFALATVGREIFPRYVLFTTPYFLLAVAYLFDVIGQYTEYGKWIAGSLAVVMAFYVLPFDYYLLTSPPEAPIPPTDYRQLISEHTSGYGLDQVYQFIDEKSQKQKITLVTQGTFGLYPYAFTLQYWGNPRVDIHPVWPIVSASDVPVIQPKTNEYIIIKEVKEGDSIPQNLPLKLVYKAEKPGGMYPILVTQLR